MCNIILYYLSVLKSIIYLIIVTLLSYLLIVSYYYNSYMQYSNIHRLKHEYDYIIVGAGSAGSYVASRLAENKNNRILVLEAGTYYSPEWLFDIPILGLLFQQSLYDWNYETTSQTPHACRGLNDGISKWPMGRVVGGTSMFNNMIYLKGLQSDYDMWYKDNYNYKYDVDWHFDQSTTFINNCTVENRKILKVQNIRYSTSLTDYILNGIEQLGYQVLNINHNNDYNNNKDKKGYFMKTQVNQNEYGERWTTGHHLKRNVILNNNNDNVLLLTNAYVIKILFDNTSASANVAPYEAHSVQFEHFNKVYQVYAKHEIILSAGVVNSPKILMLSGIGNKSDLSSIGIDSWNDLPVGYNLRDHITTGFDLIAINRTFFDLNDLLSPMNFIKYLFDGNGPFTTPACEVIGILNDDNGPQLGIMVMPMGINIDNGYKLRHLIGITNDVWLKYYNKMILNNVQTITILPILLHPFSSGTIKLKDSNYQTSPQIDPQYLSNTRDVEVLMEGIAFIQELLTTHAMQRLNAHILTNITIPECGNDNNNSDKSYWECYIRYITLTTYHPIGTNSIGQVVTHELNVMNTNKLRVVDGSVIPSLPSTNVHSSILMLADQSIDFIKKTKYRKQYQHQSHLIDLFVYVIVFNLQYKCI